MLSTCLVAKRVAEREERLKRRRPARLSKRRSCKREEEDIPCPKGGVVMIAAAVQRTRDECLLAAAVETVSRSLQFVLLNLWPISNGQKIYIQKTICLSSPSLGPRTQTRTQPRIIHTTHPFKTNPNKTENDGVQIPHETQGCQTGSTGT